MLTVRNFPPTSGLVVCLVLALLRSAAAGQPPVSLLDRYTQQDWGIEQGLPQGTVRAILQTRDGYLWLATYAGVARFDGLTFTIFDVTNTPALRTNRTYALYEDREGTLWIGSDLGLTRYRDGTFTSVPLVDGPSQPNVAAFREDREGRLWIGTTLGLFLRDGNRLTHLSLPNNGVSSVVIDRGGDVWAGTHRGVARVRDGRLVRFYTEADGLSDVSVLSMGQDRDGTIFVGTFASLFRFSGERFVGEAPRTAGWRGAITTDRDGSLWTGAGNTLQARDATGAVSSLQTTGDILAIAQDREGRIWFGTKTGPGLHRLTPRRVTMFGLAQGLPCDSPFTVTEGRDGTVWMGTACKGLVALHRDGRIESDVMGDGWNALSILATRDGSIWVGDWGKGVRVRRNNGQVTRFPLAGPSVPPDATPRGHIITCLYEDATGAVWTGLRDGVSRFSGNRWQHYYNAKDGLAPGVTSFITGDATGAVWIGTAGGLSRLANGSVTTYTTANGLSHDDVRAIHVDARDTVWIGTMGGGLNRLAHGRFTHYTTNEGLLENTVLRILEDDHGALWLTGNRGITRVTRASLTGVSTSARTMLDAVLYGKADGMTDPECQGGNGAQPAGWKMRDGTLWIPTMAGVARINPATLRPNPTPPPIVIEQVKADDVVYPRRGAIEIPPGRGNVEIRYTGLSLAASDRNRFKYRLDGYDRDWIEAGTRRVAIYTGLPPGSYRFRVIGNNSDGTWNDAGATLALSLQPRWYQRRVTQGLGVIALCALAFGVYRLRLRQLTRRTRVLETVVTARTGELRHEREQLARANERLTGAHTQLQRAHDHVVALIDHLSLGVIMVDEHGTVTLANEVVSSLLGVTPEQMINRPWDQLLPLSENERGALHEMAANPRPGRRIRARLRTADDGRYSAEIEVQHDPRETARRVFFLHEISALADTPRAAAAPHFDSLIGDSPQMRLIYKQIQDVASADTTVLVEGETGTGKELVARAIHRTSRRKDRTFVAVNCAGLTETLLASQLFGHRRGSFTGALTDHVGFFEAAHGGTLFLDEIGDMPLNAQTNLLRALQEREILRVGDSQPRPVDVRVIAATHRNLADEIAAGRFRQDLFYRIRVSRIIVPPLRTRREDIPMLAARFLDQARTGSGKSALEIGRETMEALVRHEWPGNVRELKSVLESAALHVRGSILRLGDLTSEVAGVPLPSAAEAAVNEREFLLDALKRAAGNRSLAARLLGISRTTLYRRLAVLASGTRTSVSSTPGAETRAD